MSIQVLPDILGLGQALPQIGSALGQGLQKRGERATAQEQKEKERQRQAQTGTILQNVISSLGEFPSISNLQSALTSAIEQGADPTIVNQFAQQYAPFFKEQARVQGLQDYRSQLLGQKGKMQEDFQEEVSAVTPQGDFYAQVDGVPDGITQDQIDAMIMSPYRELQEQGKLYENRRQEARKSWERDREFHAKGLKKTEEKVQGLREKIPKRKRVINLAKNSVQSGEVGQFSRNRIADIVGGPIGDAMRTKSGAEFALAAKENLVSNMGQIAAKANNIFMEKRLLDAFAQSGQSEAANLSVLNFLEADEDLDNAYLKAYERLADEDLKRYGFERKDLDRRATEAAQEEREKIFRRSSYRERKLQEQDKGPQWMYAQTNKKVEKGTPLTPEMYRIFVAEIGDPGKALSRAKQLGYKIYSPEEIGESL